MILKTTVGELLSIVDGVWETTDVKLNAVASNILLKGIHKANDSWLYVYSTDYDSQCLAKLSVDINESFICTVKPEDITKGIRTLNQETDLIITIDKGKPAVLKAGPVKYKFPVSDLVAHHESTMNTIPKLSESNKKVYPTILITGIKASLFAVSKNPAMYGVTRSMSITSKGNKLTFAATDGYVAAVTIVDIPETEEFSFNLSKEHLQKFLRLLTANKAGEAEIHTEGSGPMFFKLPELLFGCNKVTGKLPDINAVINRNVVVSTAKVTSKEFKECLRRASLFTNDQNGHSIKLATDRSKLTISTVDFEETITTTSAEPAEVTVRKDYILECISSCKGEEIELCFPEGNKALIIKDSFKDEDITLNSKYILIGMA